jgi:hypothetical protein
MILKENTLTSPRTELVPCPCQQEGSCGLMVLPQDAEKVRVAAGQAPVAEQRGNLHNTLGYQENLRRACFR